MVSNCITCAGFGICDHPNRLGEFQSSRYSPSIEIIYDEEHLKQVNSRRHSQSSSTNSTTSSSDGHALISPIVLVKRPSGIINSRRWSSESVLPHELSSFLDDVGPRFPLYIQLPQPDDSPFDDNMTYFLGRRLDTFLGLSECFSSAYESVCLLSTTNSVLRNVLFAFITYINSKDRTFQAAQCAIHLHDAIPSLQRALLVQNIDDGNIIAVVLLAYLAFWWRKATSAKSHLNGFLKMLLHAKYLDLDEYGKVSPSAGMPPLVLLFWRAAVRLDQYFAFLRPEDQTMPPIKSSPESSLRYITHFVDRSLAENTQWLLLMDELEDLRNLTVHYNRRAMTVQLSSNYSTLESEKYIRRAEAKLIQKIERSLSNLLLTEADHKNRSAPIIEPVWSSPVEPFPAAYFPFLVEKYEAYSDRLIEASINNRVILIHSTIAGSPIAGPTPEVRFRAAVEICYAILILKRRSPFAVHGRGRFLQALMFAGYTFCSAKCILGIPS